MRQNYPIICEICPIESRSTRLISKIIREVKDQIIQDFMQDGLRHRHDPNLEVIEYTCHKGHVFRVAHFDELCVRGCDWSPLKVGETRRDLTARNGSQ